MLHISNADGRFWTRDPQIKYFGLVGFRIIFFLLLLFLIFSFKHHWSVTLSAGWAQTWLYTIHVSTFLLVKCKGGIRNHELRVTSCILCHELQFIVRVTSYFTTTSYFLGASCIWFHELRVTFLHFNSRVAFYFTSYILIHELLFIHELLLSRELLLNRELL